MRAVATEARPAPAAGAGPVSPQSDAPTPGGLPQLAYSHSTQLETPADQVEAVLRAQEAACQRAGPSTCLVVGIAVRSDDDVSNGELSLRATPAWIARSKAGLPEQLEAARGRIVDDATTTEDLTRSITDSAARLNSLVVLRGRVEQLVRERSGKLSDVLEAERELARLQGEIEALTSALADMRGRVAMSSWTISVSTRVNPVAASAFSPVADAFGSFAYLASQTVGAIIRLAAVLLPVGLLLGPLVWWGLRWRRQRRERRIAADLEAAKTMFERP